MFRTRAITYTMPCSYRQVNYWVRLGYLHPENPGEGSGTDTWFFGDTYMHARQVARLVHIGVTAPLADMLARGFSFEVEDHQLKLIPIPVPTSTKRTP